MADISNQQMFRCPIPRDPQYGVPVNFWAVLSGLGCLFLIWVAIFHPPYDRTQTPYLYLSVVMFGLITWLFIYLWNNQGGSVVIDDEGITRIYGNGSSVALRWDEVVYSEVNKRFFGTPALQARVTSRSGKPVIVLHDCIEDYQKLKAEIQAKVN